MDCKTGDEEFKNTGNKKLSVKGFWQWSSSDLLNNVLRGRLAEFLIASALDLESKAREEWAAYDLKTQTGLTIEVKSASYVQSWYQSKPSVITFGINETQAWNSLNNTFAAERKRQADLYIFCLLTEQDRNKVDPTDLDQWTFYVLDTDILNQKLPIAKSLSLKKLLTLNPVQTDYSGLKEAINLLERLKRDPTAPGHNQLEN